MSAKQTSAAELGEIQLLVISPTEDSAEALRTLLRDAGYNVHINWLNKPENLADELNRSLPRLICCEQDAGDQELIRLVSLCKNVARGIPVVALMSRPSAKRSEELIQAGAAQVVSLSQKRISVWALQRELERISLLAQARDNRRQIRQLEQRLGVIVSESPEALAYVHEGIHTQLNQAYARVFGFEEPDELEGVPLMDLIAPQARGDIKALLTTTMKKQDSTEQSGTFVAQRADDSHVSMEMRCRRARLNDEEQLEVRVSNPVNKTLPAAPGNAFASRLSLYEALSNNQALGLKERSVGLLFIQIDHQTELQERLGLPAVDHIFNEVSMFLWESLADEDRSFRFGVGEFVLLCGGASPTAVEQTAENFRAGIDTEIFGDEKGSSSLTASIAVVHLDPDKSNIGQLLRAMQLANRTSRAEGNSVATLTNANPQLSTQQNDQVWLERIKTSLEQNRFTLAYQSIASLDGGSGHLHDVFVRMLGDKGEEIRAAEFFPVAQRHGLLPTVDQWVVRHLLETTQNNTEVDENTTLFIKLAQETIESADIFLPWLQEQLAHSQADAASFVISFDQNALQANIKKATAVAHALRETGFQLAIHNFGVTPQSLKLLDLMDVGFVKIDPELTNALAATAQDTGMSEMVKAAQSRNIKIIGAQVQDANSMARLWQAGVNYVQGYFVQEPGATVRTTKPSVA